MAQLVSQPIAATPLLDNAADTLRDMVQCRIHKINSPQLASYQSQASSYLSQTRQAAEVVENGHYDGR